MWVNEQMTLTPRHHGVETSSAPMTFLNVQSHLPWDAKNMFVFLDSEMSCYQNKFGGVCYAAVVSRTIACCWWGQISFICLFIPRSTFLVGVVPWLGT